MSVRRLLLFILTNIIVSATVVLAILFWWDSRQNGEAEPVAAATAPPTTMPVAAATGPAQEMEAQAEEDEGDGPTVYAVKAGDTLGSISRAFDVPIEDIMSVNGIEDPNFLQVNQELIIPVGGIAEATPEPTETPLPDVPPTPIPAQLPSEGEAEVTIGEVVGAGELADEAISITNTGSRPIALLGWRLLDEAGHAYTFGQVTLFGDGAAILVHTTGGLDGPADLYWGLDEAVWQDGVRATLVDAEGATRSTFVVGES